MATRREYSNKKGVLTRKEYNDKVGIRQQEGSTVTRSEYGNKK